MVGSMNYEPEVDMETEIFYVDWTCLVDRVFRYPWVLIACYSERLITIYHDHKARQDWIVGVVHV
jgi:hypothetical protein